MEALLLSGGIGFGSAILIHPAIGYNDLSHLAPALLGAGLFGIGMAVGIREERHSPFEFKSSR
jgi:hypothetical protein